MKNIRYKHLRGILFPFLVAMLILMGACEDDKVGAPVITSVRNYAASPDDTLVTTIQSGQWVVIHGQNLGDVSQVYFSTILANVNSALFTDESIVVQIPTIPFESVPASQKNEITVISEGGVDSYNISVVGPPLIMRVRNYADSPNDTILNRIVPGQQINMIGFNLNNATTIAFQGIAADLTNIEYTDSSTIIQVPTELSGGDASLVNMISYTTNIGTVTFSIKILGPPIITRVSYENPNEGDLVYLYGNNFVSIQSLTFAGTPISSYEVSSDESTIEFAAPALTQSGPVTITTQAGSFTTIYNVNDLTTGVLCNFDDISPVGWGGSGATIEDDPAKFPGNKEKYAILQNDLLGPWDWAAWNGKRIIVTDAVQWLPVENINDPLDSWAVKFEISVPDAWNGTTLFVSSEHNDYRYAYEPWKDESGQTFSYTTNGWETVVVPLSLFRKDWGREALASSIADLLGDGGNTAICIQTMNIADKTTITGLNAAVDNIRVVKIK
jgi:hypothetical protein